MIKNKKIALITGGTGVIGSNLTQHFIENEYLVVVTGRSKEKLEELKKRFGNDVYTYLVDVSNYEDVKKLFESIEKEIGSLDVLIPAAGIYGEINSVENCDIKSWEKAFKVNVFGVVAVVKYALPLLKNSSSANIIMFAGGGEGALSNFSSYVSSKGAILRLGETLAEELKEYNIRVNTIYPGLVNSGFVKNIIEAGPERAGKKSYEEAVAQVEGETKTITSDKAGELCLFLASEKAKDITGKLFAARWDNLEDIEKHKNYIMDTDIYTNRRLKPKHLGYDW